MILDSLQVPESKSNIMNKIIYISKRICSYFLKLKPKFLEKSNTKNTIRFIENVDVLVSEN
jgi:hypothetical protein